MNEKQREEELRRRFDGQIEMFKICGEAIVFGRLEAYKEIAEAFGYIDLVKYIEHRAKELTELRVQGKLPGGDDDA